MNQLRRMTDSKKIPHKPSIQAQVIHYPIEKVQLVRTPEEWKALCKKGKV